MVVMTIYDKKTGIWKEPFFVVATGIAVRMFTDIVNNNRDDNHLCKYAGDYDLYELGTFDQTTCLITVYDEPRKLGNGLDYQTERTKKKLLEG